MHAAAMRSAFVVIEWLISQGCDVNRVKENDGRTPLHMAATYSNVTMVQLLIDEGAHVTHKGVNDWTALLLAILFSNTDIVELLLENGASAHDRVLV
jgi:26S proteasome non-ATPase regulatory subunit 10